MMFKRTQKVSRLLDVQRRDFIIKVVLMMLLFGFINTCYAEGADLLEGTGNDLLTTIAGGRFKTYLYLSEGLFSLIAFIKTKNPLILTGIIVVAFFFNLICHVAMGGA